jgi:hypothetical protein
MIARSDVRAASMPNTSSHEQGRKKPEGVFMVERRESQEGGGEPGSLGGGKICSFHL